MQSLLICPSERPAVERLADTAPLAAVPLLGHSLVEYWLAHLSVAGIRHVRILADDRAEHIHALVGGGERWGLQAEVIAESRELTPAQALLKYAGEKLALTSLEQIAVLDHFPGMPESPLFTSYADWFAALALWAPRARMPDRVGVREIKPGVWVGLHARVSSRAQLRAPCWIGQRAYVGPDAIVGPMAFVEDRAFIERGAELVNTAVGPDTLVGQLACLRDSFALGSTLVNWKTDSCITVPDAFLLCALRSPAPVLPAESTLRRAAEVPSASKENLDILWKHLLMKKEGGS
jgi:NDP-sugar pyrophosphorylase family protein